MLLLNTRSGAGSTANGSGFGPVWLEREASCALVTAFPNGDGPTRVPIVLPARGDGAVAPVRLLSVPARRRALWRMVMAKSQKRSNREIKKPKAAKKNVVAPSTTVPGAFAKPKPVPANPAGKK